MLMTIVLLSGLDGYLVVVDPVIEVYACLDDRSCLLRMVSSCI